MVTEFLFEKVPEPCGILMWLYPLFGVINLIPVH